MKNITKYVVILITIVLSVPLSESYHKKCFRAPIFFHIDKTGISASLADYKK